MKIGFVLPEMTLGKVRQIVEAEFPEVEAEYIIYDYYSQVPELIADKQQNFDALIFTGQAPFEYAGGRIQPQTIWCYFPRAGSTMLRALLEASLKGWDITNLSIDTYSQQTIAEVYDEFGIPPRQLRVRSMKAEIENPQYHRAVLDFHCQNYRSGAACGIITCLQWVHRELNRLKIPNVMAGPTSNIVREQIQLAQQIYRARCNAQSPLAVLLIHIGLPDFHALDPENEYQFMLEKTKILQQVYRYAQQIQAAVTELSNSEFLLFAAKDIVEAETRQYRSLSLLEWLEDATVQKVSIGVAHSGNISAARRRAVEMMTAAQKVGQNAAFVSLADGKVLGPVFAQRPSKPASPVDGRLSQAAERAGISVNTANRLYRFLLSCGREGITAQELAQGLGISKRGADRLLGKLEQAGCLQVIGKRMLRETGRPARIVKIDLFQ